MHTAIVVFFTRFRPQGYFVTRTAPQKFNVVLIGTGMVSNTHLLALKDLCEHVRLQGVLARSAQSALRFSEKAAKVLGYEPTAYPSLEALVDDAPDFAIVATPPNARTEIVAALAAKRIPILMEKPVERTAAAARTIVEICEAAQIPLGIVFQHRARAVVADLRALLATGSLGKIEMVAVNVPWWRDQSYYDAPGRGTLAQDGGGVLITQAIHTLDLMLSLVGPICKVQAMAATTGLHQMETEDFVSAGFHFAGGAVGSLTATTAAYPGSAESITLHCRNAVAHLQSGELTLHWRHGKTETFGASAKTGGSADPMAFTHTWHRDVLADFITALRSGQPPMVPGRAALAVHELIDALLTSAAQDRAITLDPPYA
jgi:predicted dehydrogenase